jgi:hypothetical protein
MMRAEIEYLLKRLEDAEWFAAVGQPLAAEAQHSVVAIASWEEAVVCCSSVAWENYSLEQQNLLTMYLHEHARDRYRGWNGIVQAIKEDLHPLVERKLPLALSRLKVAGGPTQVRNSVQWDILGACMELEYADVREPAFFCGLMTWYLAGRFPCGWGERGDDGEVFLHGPMDKNDYDPNEPDWLKLILSSQERLFQPKVSLPKTGKLLVY